MRRLGPLARKLLTVMTVAAVLPTLAATVGSFLIYRGAHFVEIARQQGVVASLAADRLATELRRVQDALFAVSRSPHELDALERLRVAVQLSKNIPELDSIAWLGERGEETFRWELRHVVSDEDYRDRGDTEMWRRLRAGERYVGPVRTSENGEPVVVVAVPGTSLDAERRPTGGIAATVGLRTLWDLSQELDLAAGESVYVVDATGRLIGHENPALTQALPARFEASLAGVVEAVGWGARSARATGLEGDEVFLASAPVDGVDWIAIAERPVSTVVADFRHMMLAAAALVAAVLLVAGLYVVTAAERIARPVQELTFDSVRLAGTGAEPVLVEGDEIDALRANFRRMRATLSEKERRLTWAAKRLGALHELERAILEGCAVSELPGLAALALERTGISARAAICAGDCALEDLGIPQQVRRELCPCDELEHRTVAVTAPGPEYVLGAPLAFGGPYRRVTFVSKSPELHDQDVVEMVERLMDAVRLALDKHRLEESLETERRLVSAVVADAPTIIVTISADGLVESANPAIREIVGREPSDVVGKHVQSLDFIGLDASAIPSDANAKLRWETSTELEGGEFRVITWTASSRSPAVGGRSGLIAIGADASEQRRLETRLRLAQKMEAVGQLAGGIAHDFNNLLTVITGYGSLLLAQAGLDDRTTGRLEQITKAGERAAALTHQLLAFSRRQVLNPRVIELNVLLRGLKPLLGRVLEEDIEVVLELGQDLFRTRADAAQMEQVMLNLAINARDAMPDGGTLRISTGNRQFDEPLRRGQMVIPRGHYALVRVQDTGTGIDESVRERVFEPFFTTKELGKGTGLGLSSAYGIVKQSGGYILLDSQSGIGTTFEILLPREDGDVSEEPKATGGASGHGFETVLVVEDDREVRSLAVSSLEQLGYTVLEAEDGLAAMHVAEGFSGNIDLLLSDAVMPRMSGPDLATRLAALRPDMKVLLMSGYLDRVHTAAADGLPFLEKPFTPNALGSRVRQVLDHTAG